MKGPLTGLVPCALAATGLAAFAAVLACETRAYRRSVEGWALRDLAARAQLAAEALDEPLGAGDIERVRAYGAAHRADGVRLTVLSAPGGMVYDSEARAQGGHGARPEVERARAQGEGAAIRTSATTHARMLYCARRLASGGVVRLALPYARVVEPLDRTRAGLVLAALAGGSGILLVFLFTSRLLARNRALARERDVQTRILAEMRRVADFRRDFVANVSHEIKTPLTGILGAVEMLDAPDADALDADARAQLYGMLRRESGRLNALAEDVLALARLEQDDAAARSAFAPADLAEILRTAAARVTPEAEAAGVALAVEAAPGQVVSCDARLVEQALVNLLANAVRHSGARTVRAALAPDRPVFTVEDRGRGIPEADRARIFERFYRVDKAHSTPGTGLGLAIVKHVAELHGGTVTLETPSAGGARFVLALGQD